MKMFRPINTNAILFFQDPSDAHYLSYVNDKYSVVLKKQQIDKSPRGCLTEIQILKNS